MLLQNIGSILNFAEELEDQDHQFYAAASKNPACAAFRKLFTELGADARGNLKALERIRRQYAAETMLEPVQDLARESFCEVCEGAAGMSAAEALETATRLEARADRYYAEAAGKLKAVVEVARSLKALGRNRKAHIVRLMDVKR
jgi:rubrerythrin